MTGSVWPATARCAPSAALVVCVEHAAAPAMATTADNPTKIFVIRTGTPYARSGF
ncbi:MAG TPA: hypothetical protein VHV74_22940 [Pseudonocardiaceae bacterium]|nr:hypothetical protein [Pseudonocardiaceae bacterium]